MWLATLDTAHFTFAALGVTEIAAMAALRTGWEAHVARLGLHYAPSWSALADDVALVYIPADGCVRDGEVIR